MAGQNPRSAPASMTNVFVGPGVSSSTSKAKLSSTAVIVTRPLVEADIARTGRACP